MIDTAEISPRTLGDSWACSRSGILLPYQEPAKPKVLDLFCGCGGFSLGLLAAGFEVVGAVDFSVDCMQTYLVNLGSYPVNIHYITPEDRNRAVAYFEKRWKSRIKPAMLGHKGKVELMDVSGDGWIQDHPECDPVRNFWLGDIRKLCGQEILSTLGMERGELDCICGGPPCQGFSTAGRRSVADPRNNLVFEFARLVVEIQPKTLVMENVPGILDMVTPEGIPVLDVFGRILQDGGFQGVDAIKKVLRSTSGCGMVNLQQRDPDLAADRKGGREVSLPRQETQLEMF